MLLSKAPLSNLILVLGHRVNAFLLALGALGVSELESTVFFISQPRTSRITPYPLHSCHTSLAIPLHLLQHNACLRGGLWVSFSKL
ncbi:uncharacterized protein BJ212DRAFT_1413087 [Suillus subaureus]|uniref:Uncharacterized protein n=1 Tax=Suillus subaureus TaxID=48587 RepID=A0A9P7AQG8_9AGAM|nr:uncharacterized protein BJ212DRAFT_1413087 [Suillus subaureus]KAG1794288.1 hypothetical protein BJ212DRAFT_1413087 [Suillus subaureus]